MTISQRQQRLAEFCRLWQQADTVAEVAEAVGVTTATASSMASRLRAEGVALKRMRSGPAAEPPIDFAALAKLVKRGGWR